MRKTPWVPLELIRETALGRHKHLRADRATRFADRCGKTQKEPSERRGERLCAAQKRSDAGTHLAKGLEDAVQHDEEREDVLDGRERAADDETRDGLAGEAERHGLLAPDAVHEEAAGDAAGEIEAVHRGAEVDVLDEGVVGVELSDDGSAEEAERIGQEVVEGPGETRAKHGLPIALDCEQVGGLCLDGVFAVLCAVDHADTEEEEENRWKDHVDTKRDSPDAFGDLLVVGREDDKRDDTGC